MRRHREGRDILRIAWPSNIKNQGPVWREISVEGKRHAKKAHTHDKIERSPETSSIRGQIWRETSKESKGNIKKCTHDKIWRSPANSCIRSSPKEVHK